jgi:hypothetical protein
MINYDDRGRMIFDMTKVVANVELPTGTNEVWVNFTDGTHLHIYFYEDCAETHVRLVDKTN